METDYVDQADPCPCDRCTDCTYGFEKVVNLKNSGGFVIYLHMKNSAVPDKDTGSLLSTKTATLILHNIKDTALKSSDIIPEIEQTKITCPRCREIMNHALRLLHRVPAITINSKDITGICDYCGLKQPCHVCNESVKKLAATIKNETKQNAKERVREQELLSKLDKTSLSEKESIKKWNKKGSESRIDQFINKESTRSERGLVITDLLYESKAQGLAKTKTRSADKRKKQIGFKLDSFELKVDETSRTIIDRTEKKLNLPVRERLDDNEQFNPSDLEEIYGLSISAPDTIRDYHKAKQMTGGSQQLLKEIPLITLKSKEDVMAHKKENMKDEKKYYTTSNLQRKDYPEDDILAANFGKYKHDNEKDFIYDENSIKNKFLLDRDKGFNRKIKYQQYTVPADSGNLSHTFSFSFPQEIVVEDTLKRHKSSSELIRDTKNMLLAKAEQEKIQHEMERKRKISEDERKRLAKEDKARIDEEKTRQIKQKKIAEEEKKMNEEVERNQNLQPVKLTSSASTTEAERKEYKEKTGQKSKSDIKVEMDSKETLKDIQNRDKYEKQLLNETTQKQRGKKGKQKQVGIINEDNIKGDADLRKKNRKEKADTDRTLKQENIELGQRTLKEKGDKPKPVKQENIDLEQKTLKEKKEKHTPLKQENIVGQKSLKEKGNTQKEEKLENVESGQRALKEKKEYKQKPEKQENIEFGQKSLKQKITQPQQQEFAKKIDKQNVETTKQERVDIEQKPILEKKLQPQQQNLKRSESETAQKSKREATVDTLNTRQKTDRRDDIKQDQSPKAANIKYKDLIYTQSGKNKIESKVTTPEKKGKSGKGDDESESEKKSQLREEKNIKDQPKESQQIKGEQTKDQKEEILEALKAAKNFEKILKEQGTKGKDKQDTIKTEVTDSKIEKQTKAKTRDSPKIKNSQPAEESKLGHGKMKQEPKQDSSLNVDVNKIKMLGPSQGDVLKATVTQKEAQANLKGDILKQKPTPDHSGDYKRTLKPTKSLKDVNVLINRGKTTKTPQDVKSKQMEINIEGIKLLRPSQDYFVLELVKLKQSNKKKLFLSDVMTPLEIEAHRRHHKAIADKKCFMCINSNIELEYEIRNNKKSDLTTEIVKGPKLFKCMYPHVDKSDKNQESLPRLYSHKYDVLPIPETKAAEIPPAAPVEEKLTPRPTGKTNKSTTETEVEAKGIIRYALSDRTFIEKGWTLLPTEKVVRKMNVYRMRPAHPEFDWFEHNKNKGMMTYDSGERLAEFDDNGRGRWYYRNGRLALDYYDAEELNAQQRFVVYSTGQPDERGRSQPYTIIATFDYLGNGIVFDHSGKIRLKYNQTEGIVLDRNIGPVSHWKWHTLNDPPVLQQVMIDTQMAHKDPDILKLGGPHDGKARPENEEMLAIEFDNFIKEKSKKLSQSFKPFQIKMKALKINDHFSLRVLDQATVYLIFRDGTTNLKLNIGMILDHKEIVDTDTAEVGEVSNSLERFPARTDSLAGLQKSVAYAERFERNRTERERRLRPPEPCASADKLTAAISRPLRPPLPLRSGNSTTTASTSRYCYRNRKPTSNNIYYDNRLL